MCIRDRNSIKPHFPIKPNVKVRPHTLLSNLHLSGLVVREGRASPIYSITSKIRGENKLKISTPFGLELGIFDPQALSWLHYTTCGSYEQSQVLISEEPRIFFLNFTTEWSLVKNKRDKRMSCNEAKQSKVVPIRVQHSQRGGLSTKLVLKLMKSYNLVDWRYDSYEQLISKNEVYDRCARSAVLRIPRMFLQSLLRPPSGTQ